VLETAILGFLADSDLHGYELKKRIAELVAPWSRVSFGSLYPALTRLEKAGLIRVVRTVDAPAPLTGSLGAEVAAFRAKALQGATSLRGRKVFALTETGRARLSALLRDTSGDDRDFAVRVAFYGLLDAAERLELFTKRRDGLANSIDSPAPAAPLRDRYRTMVSAFQVDRLVREQSWIDQLIEQESTTSLTTGAGGTTT
jgi:DNA-binding PadR family transcriptional regulator